MFFFFGLIWCFFFSLYIVYFGLMLFVICYCLLSLLLSLLLYFPKWRVNLICFDLILGSYFFLLISYIFYFLFFFASLFFYLVYDGFFFIFWFLFVGLYSNANNNIDNCNKWFDIYVLFISRSFFDIVKLSYFISDSLSTKAIYYNL